MRQWTERQKVYRPGNGHARLLNRKMWSTSEQERVGQTSVNLEVKVNLPIRNSPQAGSSAENEQSQRISPSWDQKQNRQHDPLSQPTGLHLLWHQRTSRRHRSRRFHSKVITNTIFTATWHSQCVTLTSLQCSRVKFWEHTGMSPRLSRSAVSWQLSGGTVRRNRVATLSPPL